MTTSTLCRQQIAQIIDLEQFPIDDLTRPESLVFADLCRQQYQTTGLCMLQGFVRPTMLAQLVRESADYIDDAFFCHNTHNAYLTEKENTGADDIEHHQEQTFVGSVPCDRISDQTWLKQLYYWDPLKDFIGHVLGKKPLHRFADPLGACSVNVFTNGGAHGWHFDESEFTVTLMLQPPSSGGSFEYAPLVRGNENEAGILRDIMLNGARDEVLELPFTAGTLLIFGGRQTLHRVTRVEGTQPRLVPVLCYSEQPGQQNSEAVRNLFWGRAGADAG